MNRKITLLSLLIFTSFCALAQDTLYFVNQNKVICRVLRINMGNVFYVKNDSTPRSKEIGIPKSTVRCIAYGNGSIEILSVKNIRPPERNSNFLKGSSDAQAYYHHPGGSIATGLVSFATGGILGLIPAIACSATTPRFANLNLPKNAMLTNKEYMLGYISTAKNMKQRKVWKGYVLGVGAAIAFVILTKH